ncbi:MAG: hypothetical protein BWY83_03184 [bacterium ADurb.Bin478]|nr:MAG: hypothetical protein BWY83_03184 [bacterium ADurb.Bin478]
MSRLTIFSLSGVAFSSLLISKSVFSSWIFLSNRRLTCSNFCTISALSMDLAAMLANDVRYSISAEENGCPSSLGPRPMRPTWRWVLKMGMSNSMSNS